MQLSAVRHIADVPGCQTRPDARTTDRGPPPRRHHVAAAHGAPHREPTRLTSASQRVLQPGPTTCHGVHDRGGQARTPRMPVPVPSTRPGS